MTLQPINYSFTGDQSKVLEVTLAPGETVLAESGALVYMDEGVAYETCLGDGSEVNPGIVGKIFPSSTRPLTGDALFYTYFTNYGRNSGKVVLSSPYNGVPHRISLEQFGNELVIQRGAFLCSQRGTKLVSLLVKKNDQPVKNEIISLYKVSGSSDVFVSVGGMLIEKNLDNEQIRVDASSIVAFEPQLDFSIDSIGDVKTMMLGNDTFILGTLRGKGKVWLQSISVRKMLLCLYTAGQHMNMVEKAALGHLYE